MARLDLRESIVQIRHSASGDIVGTGFVVSERLVVTCAHVLAQAGQTSSDRIRVVFHLNQETRWARMLPNAWRAPEREDIAVLQLEGDLPAKVKPLLLGSSAGCEGHAFRAFGYAQIGDVQGLWATGKIQGNVKQAGERQFVQLSSPELDRGISGGPVLDLKRSRVIGMVTAVYYPDETTKNRDTGLAVPADVIHQACPDIPLEPVPLGELVGAERSRLAALMDRQLWTVLWGRLQSLVRVQPVFASFIFLGMILTGLATSKAVDAWLNRNWILVEGNSALLCTDDWNCSWPTPPFQIQVTEVTNQDYLQCVHSKGCDPPGGVWSIGPGGWGFPTEFEQHPVIIPTWQEANRYCQFIGARLATEAEWVLAARGATTRKYPWGDTFDAVKANTIEARKGTTVAVNQDPGASTSPIHHMIGNLREWVNGAVDPRDRSKGFGAPIAKGGSYSDSAPNSTIDARFPGTQVVYTGVRCARDVR